MTIRVGDIVSRPYGSLSTRADVVIQSINDLRYILIAKKKLTIPYKDPQPNEA